MGKNAVIMILDEVEKRKLERSRPLLENIDIYKNLLVAKESFMIIDVSNSTPVEINDMKFKIVENLLLFKIEIKIQKKLPITKEYLDLYKLYELGDGVDEQRD